MPRLTGLAYPSELLPLRSHLGDWVFHYPVFLNTYCLAFHLGRLVFEIAKDQDPVLKSLKRQDHWAVTNKSPEQAVRDSFTEKHKVELFIAGEEMITKLKIVGEKITTIPFTSYRLRSVLLHRQKTALQAGIKDERTLDIKTYDDLVTFVRSTRIKKFYIITDVPPTAKEFKADLLSKSGAAQRVDFQIRDYWSREEGDFYDTTPKLYVFSAPLLSILKTLKSKYCVVDVASFAPFETYVGAKIRAGTPDKLVADVTSSISQYFSAVFALANTVDALQPKTIPAWWRGAGRCYSRAADSSRQPDPFPKAKYSLTPQTADDLAYLRILKQHQ
jgi:hypothetical protein